MYLSRNKEWKENGTFQKNRNYYRKSQFYPGEKISHDGPLTNIFSLKSYQI